MEYETFSPVFNRSYSEEIDESSKGFTKMIFHKLGLPSYLPYFLLGPALQVIISFLLLPYTPSSVLTSSTKRMKWRTTFIARLSAAITGSWALYILINTSDVFSDLMFTSSVSAKNLVVFSLGVHIVEAADMILHGKPSMLLLHHILVVICFTGAVVTNKAVGFAVLSLVTEVNAVFNKTRILHIITDTNTESVEYRRNAILNIITFFIRILIIGWMNNQCFLYIDILPISFLVPCILGLGIVNIWNFSVFKTLLKKDILAKPKTD